MAWIYLLLAGLFEIGWAVGIKLSAGLTRPLPAAATLAAMLASLWLLSLAVRTIPLGTAYAVWTGIGAVGVAAVGIGAFGESAQWPRLVSLALIVTGIAGLHLTSGPRPL